MPAYQALPEASVVETEASAQDTTQQLYEPLCEWQTRLIELLPADKGGQLRCTLHVADIIILPGLGLARQRKRVEYEALSYSWGHPDRTASILCNGVWTYIPPTLAEALQAFRLEGEARWLWCDALSINQNDPREKSAQVRIMLTIFFKASGVVAWLGPSDEATARAFGVLVRGRNLDSGTDSAMKCLCERQWFRRTWVRQEVFASRQLSLQSGSDLLTSETLLSLVRDGVPYPPLLEPVHSRATRSPEPDSLSGNLTTDFMEVLRSGAGFDATDPRDKVYALLGMIKGLDSTLDLQRPSSGTTLRDRSPHCAFPIDYGRSVSQVYQDVMKYLINETGSLDCLNYLGPRGRRGDLPSWALDWADRQDCERLYLHFGADFFGSGLLVESRPVNLPRKRHRRAPLQTSAHDGELCLHGHVIGLVGDRPTNREEHDFLEPPEISGPFMDWYWRDERAPRWRKHTCA